jgi:hypothetical protein
MSIDLIEFTGSKGKQAIQVYCFYPEPLEPNFCINLTLLTLIDGIFGHTDEIELTEKELKWIIEERSAPDGSEFILQSIDPIEVDTQRELILSIQNGLIHLTGSRMFQGMDDYEVDGLIDFPSAIFPQVLKAVNQEMVRLVKESMPLDPFTTIEWFKDVANV